MCQDRQHDYWRFEGSCKLKLQSVANGCSKSDAAGRSYLLAELQLKQAQISDLYSDGPD